MTFTCRKGKLVGQNINPFQPSVAFHIEKQSDDWFPQEMQNRTKIS